MSEIASFEVPVYDPILYANAIKAMIKAADMYEAIFDELLKKWDRKANRELRIIAQDAVIDFYEDYDPNSYRRLEDLFNAYEIVAKDGNWYVDMGPEFMKYPHRVGNVLGDPEKGKEYIYKNSFVEGYHGGARGGKNHPNPPEPWWKKHGLFGEFTRWWKPAKQMDGEPPESRITNEVAEFINNARVEMCDEYAKAREKYKQEAIDALKKALRSKMF